MRTRIVIADDDPVIIRLLSERLGQGDCDVMSACNGKDALAMIRANAPALAILDVRMPGLDGIQVLRALKTDAATCDIPVMMLTGERDDGTVMSAVGAGAADYMVKPFIPDRLMERVLRIVPATKAAAVSASASTWEI